MAQEQVETKGIPGSRQTAVANLLSQVDSGREAPLWGFFVFAVQGFGPHSAGLRGD